MEIVIHGTARKHGITDEDIHHAFRNTMYVAEHQDENFRMVIGGDSTGRLIEIGYTINPEGVVFLIHAMPARRKHLR